MTKVRNSSDPKRDSARSIVNGLKPGDRVKLNEGGYEIIVGMPSDAPDEPHDETEVDDSAVNSRAWFE